jgi:tetratricopeptide (TPR) repeat protein
MAGQDLQGSLQDCDKAISIDPRYAGAYYSRGLALDAMNRYREAIADYQRYIQLAGSNQKKMVSIARTRIAALSKLAGPNQQSSQQIN